MFTPRDGGKKRILAKGSEGQGESFKIIVADLLIGEGEDMMDKPPRADCGDGFGRQRLG